jgi:hypothetical protein
VTIKEKQAFDRMIKRIISVPAGRKKMSMLKDSKDPYTQWVMVPLADVLEATGEFRRSVK